MEINGKEVEVNRKDAVVRDFDKQYCELLKKILEEGELFENRTGVDTLSIPGGGYVFDVGNEFPILESKKIMLKNALSELLWIYQAQTNVVSWLRERGNNIWNEWEVDSDGIYRIYESTTEEYDEDKEVNVYDLATSFQDVVVDILTKKTMRAVKEYNVKEVIVAGGVSANSGIREKLKELCDKENVKLIVPELRYCTDNATMIAAAAYYMYKDGRFSDLTLNIKPTDKIN